VSANGVLTDITAQPLTMKLFCALPDTTALVASNTPSRVTTLTTRQEEAPGTMPSLAVLEHGPKLRVQLHLTDVGIAKKVITVQLLQKSPIQLPLFQSLRWTQATSAQMESIALQDQENLMTAHLETTAPQEVHMRSLAQ